MEARKPLVCNSKTSALSRHLHFQNTTHFRSTLREGASWSTWTDMSEDAVDPRCCACASARAISLRCQRDARACPTSSRHG